MKTLNEYMQLPYKMEIVPDVEETGFVVSFPDLPGCITCANTLEEALKNAQDAKRVWLETALEEGLYISEPNGQKDILVNRNDKIQIFEDKRIRTAWDEITEEWLFSVVDVVGVLSESDNPRRYWSDLKRKLKKEGANELYEKIVQLKMRSTDGKYYQTDVANMEQILRIVQSIPSPKAEPFKVWLAQIGCERIEETIDPELTIDRALETYLRKGYSREWINQRLQAIQVRKELADEWRDRGVHKGAEYAILTDEITKAWSGMTTRQYKNLKGLKKENLRDNMTTTEIILNMLAETSTKDISKEIKANTFEENVNVAERGGKVAGIARHALEEETGKTVISSQNALQINEMGVDMIENTENCE